MANKNILLIEPGYKNKYPPLGLMKIAQYHGPRGKKDRVRFIKGKIARFCPRHGIASTSRRYSLSSTQRLRKPSISLSKSRTGRQIKFSLAELQLR